MSTVAKAELQTAIAESMFEELISKMARYYYFVGMPLSWGGNDDPLPPMSCYKYELGVRHNIVFAKQIKASDVAFVIPRCDWEAGTIFDDYDDCYSPDNLSYSGADDLSKAKFIIVTNSFNVYKCIHNNYNAPSTIKPTLTDSEQFTTADGYIWKFLYNVPPYLRNKFILIDYIPVSNSIKNSFYSKGSITNFSIDNPGSGYTQVATSIVVSGDGYIEENPHILTAVTLISGGSGYTSTPGITFTAPSIESGSEIQATGTATLTGDVVTSITINNFGYGYESDVSLDVDPPFIGSEWKITTVYANNDKIYWLGKYYEVLGNGNTGISPPNHDTGTEVNGSVNLLFIGETARALVNTSKTEGALSPIITGGQLTNVIINDPGIGYTNVTLTVVGDGTGASVSTDITTGDLTTIQSTIELTATSRSIDNIKVIDNGIGYAGGTVSIVGDGYGATAELIINDAKVIDVKVLTRGSDYTWAEVIITGNGTGATARAIIAPESGHGGNAIKETYSSQLMLYSNLSEEHISNITLDNDNRQLGILKNIKTFDNVNLLRELTSSACYLLAFQNPINQALFPNDTILTTDSGKVFTVVASSAVNMLLISPQNDEPTLGETLKNADLDALDPFLITPPSFNKYSGSMLFIDNRSAFTSSNEQNVSFRTIIDF